MTGFWALARKEFLEQRRTWRFLAMVGFFTALALLISIIPYIVTLFNNDSRDAGLARDLLLGFGFSIFGFGTILSIIVAMGALASERASGTAAMTLSKPVTRAAFVAVKFLGLILAIYASLAIAGAVMYILTLILFDDGGLTQFAGFVAIIGVYLVFIASITFFLSGMFSRALLVGGLAFFLWIAQQPLSVIPKTYDYWPVHAAEWGARVTGIDDGEGNDAGWQSLPVAVGSIVVLSTGAWVVFRRKEL